MKSIKFQILSNNSLKNVTTHLFESELRSKISILTNFNRFEKKAQAKLKIRSVTISVNNRRRQIVEFFGEREF